MARGIMQVKETFQKLAVRERWEKLPVYALGASSGASMVTKHSAPCAKAYSGKQQRIILVKALHTTTCK